MAYYAVTHQPSCSKPPFLLLQCLFELRSFQRNAHPGNHPLLAALVVWDRDPGFRFGGPSACSPGQSPPPP
eukprot:CAMPEP_0174367492 /NCGR_PEP_ID=MMETSP0811_2-20130205/85532_1 /TAXON_ID=73025 ORGANISM="Eutreptiella gymnastica-like, Strain CCMP1594" /NCGR_SAMPLE_ID=MMETSP0811_2 /ASSEMBLY_ACC=CAM_ASM_000667 /LENGTH=70 /DNA_ID=CAMNT_0015510111 /DNA_START=350 /DNA_END=558 /DNA_ORIENTATION=+